MSNCSFIDLSWGSMGLLLMIFAFIILAIIYLRRRNRQACMRAAFCCRGGDDVFFKDYVSWRQANVTGVRRRELTYKNGDSQTSNSPAYANVSTVENGLSHPPPQQYRGPYPDVRMEKDRDYQELCPLVQSLIKIQWRMAAEEEAAKAARSTLANLATSIHLPDGEIISSPVGGHSRWHEV